MATAWKSVFPVSWKTCLNLLFSWICGLCRKFQPCQAPSLKKIHVMIRLEIKKQAFSLTKQIAYGNIKRTAFYTPSWLNQKVEPIAMAQHCCKNVKLSAFFSSIYLSEVRTCWLSLLVATTFSRALTATVWFFRYRKEHTSLGIL